MIWCTGSKRDRAGEQAGAQKLSKVILQAYWENLHGCDLKKAAKGQPSAASDHMEVDIPVGWVHVRKSS